MKHFKSINFVNRWHNGDIHFSRQFIKHIINNTEADNYVYYLDKSTHLLRDIKNLARKPLLELSIDFTDNLVVVPGEDIYINTWIGCEGRKYLSLYDVDEKLYNGTIHPLLDYNVSLGSNYRMYTDVVGRLGLSPLSQSPIDYIPEVDYNQFNISSCQDFLDNNLNKKRVLLCNNLVCSSQAPNFDFDPIIDVVTSEWPEIQFLVTDKTTIVKPNIYQTNSIINTQDDSNLEEHGYLSKFCDIIVGRGSGPFCFCGTKENYFNTKIRFIGMGFDLLTIFWYYNSENMKYISGYSTEEFMHVFNICLEELGIHK